MVTPGRRLAALFTTLIAAQLAVHAQQRPAPITPRSPLPLNGGPLAKGDATITGRVISASDGAPLRNAEIRASFENSPIVSVLTTDGEGRFQLTDLIEGRWTVSAAKAGYVAPRTSVRTATQPLKTIQLSAGQRQALDFALIRGAAITGNVYNDEGEPVPGVRVEAVRSRVIRGMRQLSAAITSDLTDDQGAYRLHSLPAGDYYVSASLRAAPPEEPGLGALVGVATYFPGTHNSNDAVRLALVAGQERSGISFSVSPSRPVRLSGYLTSASGGALLEVPVELLNTGDFSVATRSYGNFGMSQAGGAFTFLNVAPGSYFISARTEKTDAPIEVAFAPITVGSEDVSGISVVARRGTTLTGTVVAASGAVLPPSRVSVLARSIRESGAQTARVDAKGTFTIAGLIGPYHIDVEGLPAGWAVDSIDVAGQPAADTLVELGGVEQATARIVLTNQGTLVTGMVRRDPARTLDVSVIVFPEDEKRWGYPSRFVRAVRADAQGAFRIDGLPADARYLALAVEQLDEGDVDDPEVLQRLKPLAAALSLAAGERKTLELAVTVQ
jgi:hypothetical protein